MSFSMFFLGFAGMCSKEEVRPLRTEESLYGTWNWVASSGGLAGVEKSPASEGYNQVLEISESGVYSVFRNDTLVYESNFSIVEQESQIQNESRLMLTFENGEILDQSFFIEGSDTLILVEECWDCFAHEYVRDIP